MNLGETKFGMWRPARGKADETNWPNGHERKSSKSFNPASRKKPLSRATSRRSAWNNSASLQPVLDCTKDRGPTWNKKAERHWRYHTVLFPVDPNGYLRKSTCPPCYSVDFYYATVILYKTVNGTLPWKPISSRFARAWFKGHPHDLTATILCYPTNARDKETKNEFYHNIRETFNRSLCSNSIL